MKALLIVDVQYDFCPGGVMAIKDGDKIIPVINKLQPMFDLVLATLDWHPVDHVTFASQHPGKRPYDLVEVNGVDHVLWPRHCVQHTKGAAFVEGLHMNYLDKIFYIGKNKKNDSYSGFFDVGEKPTGLDKYLKKKGVTDLYIVGLATDFCVMFTALDARKLGYNTHVVIDATKPLDINPGDFEDAVKQMKTAGVKILESKAIAK